MECHREVYKVSHRPGGVRRCRVDDFQPEAGDPLYQPGQGSLIGQLGAEGCRAWAGADLAVVECRAQRGACLARKSDLIRL